MDKHMMEPFLLYTAGELAVFTNGSGEIFVKFNTENGPEIRISDVGRNKLVITAAESIIQPTSINGLDAFRVTKI